MAERAPEREREPAPATAIATAIATATAGRRAGAWVVGVGVAYTVLAIAALARSGYQAMAGERAGAAVALSGLAGAVYLVAAVGLRRGSARSLRMSRWCCVIELVGVVTVSLVEIGIGGFGRAAVWSGFGVGYGYLPLVLPAIGLWVTRPVAGPGAAPDAGSIR